MPPRPRPAPLLPLLLAALAACGSWPRYADLPTDEQVIGADEDPRALVQVAWTETTEDELAISDGADNGSPLEVRPTALASLEGVLVDGSLRGVGWNASFEPPPLSAEGCDDATRSPGEPGDWAGDVDFVVVEIDAEASGPVLCAEVALDQPDLGWDLLVYPLDDCGLPSAPLAAPTSAGTDTPVGLGRAGATGGWKIPLDAGARYGVLLAGYDAPDPLAEVPYRLGVSVVPDAEGRELCPLLPGGAS